MKHTDEDGDYIWTDEDRRSANRFFGFSYFGVLTVFSLIVLAPSCPDKNAQDYFEYGKHYMASGDFEQAQRYFSKAIRMNHTYFEAYEERAKAFEKTDSLTRSLQDYDTLLTFKNVSVSKTAELYFLKASNHYLLSQDTLACHAWKKACDLNHNKSCDIIRKRCK